LDERGIEPGELMRSEVVGWRLSGWGYGPEIA
jgi:hypothetical protein